METCIPTIPIIIETDENGNFINSVTHELKSLYGFMQSLYSYINKVYYDMNAKITSVKSDIDNLLDQTESNESEEKMVNNEIIAELNGRCLVMETEIENICKIKLPNLKINNKLICCVGMYADKFRHRNRIP